MSDYVRELRDLAINPDRPVPRHVLERSADRIAELEAVVREVEWGGVILDGHGEMVAACPLCDGPHAIGHAHDCRLAAALTPTSGEGEINWKEEHKRLLDYTQPLVEASRRVSDQFTEGGPSEPIRARTSTGTKNMWPNITKAVTQLRHRLSALPAIMCEGAEEIECIKKYTPGATPLDCRKCQDGPCMESLPTSGDEKGGAEG